MHVAAEIISKWGEPDRRATFTSGDVTVEVFKYEAATTGEGVVIYATATTGPSPSGHLQEFMLGLDAAHDEVAGPLATLSAYNRHTPLHHGDTVPIGDPPWPGSAFDRFLVMRQVEPVLGPFEDGAETIEVWSVVPIYPEELEPKARLGADAFIAEFQRRGIGFWDSERRSLIT